MDYKIVKAKEWVHQEGCYPSRIVLLKINKGNMIEYSTHIQCSTKHENKIKPNQYIVLGHYHTTIESAENDFKKREI